jgi:hypothetical protein
MRRLGIEYLILHGDRYGPGAAEVVREATQMPDYALVAQVGSDYLFRVKD